MSAKKVWASTGRSTAARAPSTANRVLCAHAVDDGLPTVGIARDNGSKDTKNASRPRTKGGCTPVQGLADRKDTTDS